LAIMPWLTLPNASSGTAKAFIAGGLPRGGVAVKLRPHALQR
jgi:hypothetical protein